MAKYRYNDSILMYYMKLNLPKLLFSPIYDYIMYI